MRRSKSYYSLVGGLRRFSVQNVPACHSDLDPELPGKPDNTCGISVGFPLLRYQETLDRPVRFKRFKHGIDSEYFVSMHICLRTQPEYGIGQVTREPLPSRECCRAVSLQEDKAIWVSRQFHPPGRKALLRRRPTFSVSGPPRPSFCVHALHSFAGSALRSVPGKMRPCCPHASPL